MDKDKLKKMMVPGIIAAVGILAVWVLVTRSGSTGRHRGDSEDHRAFAGETDDTLPAGEVSRLLRQYLGAALPSSAERVYGTMDTGHATIVRITFGGSARAVADFLKGSSLPDKNLKQGERVIFQSMGTESWWQPDSLSNVAGVGGNTVSGEETTSRVVMTGTTGAGADVTVYVLIAVHGPVKRN